MSRRSDIEGLCALAILAVIAFHVDPTMLSGGFAGVDVLFVVIGYLAASHIRQKLDAGGFSLAGFYAQVVRRVAPALLAMLAIVTLAVWAIWPGHAMGDYSLTLGASVIFVANLVFAGMGDYYTLAASDQPLLHLWALGLGAQFLLVLPILYVALARWAPAKLSLVLIVVTVVSYWVGVWGVNFAPERAWYMPHMRAWELMFGVLLVAGELPEIKSAAARASLAVIGLVAIAGTFALVIPGDAFPGLATIAPVLGAAMVIHAGSCGANPISTRLGARPLAAVGAASLSIYLWYWPVLVIARRWSEAEMAWVAGLVLGLGAAALSYRYVERPIRSSINWPRRRVLMLASLGALILFAVASVGVVA